MNTIAFLTANYVARQLDYNMTGGWGQGDKATQAYFQPIETFAERFDALLAEIADAIREERPHRATGEHAAQVVEILTAAAESIRTHRPVTLESRFSAPEPMEWAT